MGQVKVLLVEPAYKTRYPSLGLMKISTYLKENGREVYFVKGRKEIDFTPSEIWITSLFTFHHAIVIKTILFYKNKYPSAVVHVGGIFASIMPEYIYRHTSVNPRIGLIDAVENCAPDYDLIPTENPSSIVFTSRGCIRGCKFCVVPRIEGKLRPVVGWERGIDSRFKSITLWDNNWLASDSQKIDADLDILSASGVDFDFNQGLDCRLYTKAIHKRLSRLKIKPIRFAFDNMSEDGHIQKVLELWKDKPGFYNKSSNVIVYVLYNFMDTPSDFYYRIREIVRLGAIAFPMRYSPVDDLGREYSGRHWTYEQSRAVNGILGAGTGLYGQITVGSQEEFEMYWGKDSNEFLKIISSQQGARSHTLSVGRKALLEKLRGLR